MKIAESKRNIFRKKIDGKFPKDTKKRTGFGKNQLRKNLFVVGMLSVAMIHFLVFWLYVNLSSILMAFKKRDFGRDKMGLR